MRKFILMLAVAASTSRGPAPLVSAGLEAPVSVREVGSRRKEVKIA
jgi:hypothetical protein